MEKIRAIAQLRTSERFRRHLDEIGADLFFDELVESGSGAVLAQPFRLADGFVIGNRFCIQPMEGWDASFEGEPTDFTFRRWRNFGISGAKLIWGGEAVAVRHDGCANPNQLMLTADTMKTIAKLREELVGVHHQRYGCDDDLLVGLQLTHSGRFSRPNDKKKLEPKILFHHPYLDKKFGVSFDAPVLTDDQIEEIIDAYINAAHLAAEIGFKFVDIKHCHGYLGHEFLSAVGRSGKFGGSFENRTRFLRDIIEGIRKTTPNLRIGVRLSAFDMAAFEPDPISGVGIPAMKDHYPFCFGGDSKDCLGINLTETMSFLDQCQTLGVTLVNLTAGSPYYNPHIQRPALFPPSDGYKPPEDPLIGVARQINMVKQIKQQFPLLAIVGSAYSYLQEWLPNVGQFYVRNGMVDFIGLGRMVLSYPEMPADILTGKPIDRKHLCRTFSDCTTAPRHGLISGCYPIDEYYKDLPEAVILGGIKAVKG